MNMLERHFKFAFSYASCLPFFSFKIKKYICHVFLKSVSSWTVNVFVFELYFLIPSMFVFQYSQKEDKYEEEIKVLTDKLKEVSFFHLCVTVLL